MGREARYCSEMSSNKREGNKGAKSGREMPGGQEETRRRWSQKGSSEESAAKVHTAEKTKRWLEGKRERPDLSCQRGHIERANKNMRTAAHNAVQPGEG